MGGGNQVQSLSSVRVAKICKVILLRDESMKTKDAFDHEAPAPDGDAASSAVLTNDINNPVDAAAAATGLAPNDDEGEHAAAADDNDDNA